MLITSITNLMKHQDKRVQRAVVDCLIQLHDPSIIVHWGPTNTIMTNFWKISSQAVISIARQILDTTRQDEELLRTLLDLLANILDSRNSFVIDVSVSQV